MVVGLARRERAIGPGSIESSKRCCCLVVRLTPRGRGGVGSGPGLAGWVLVAGAGPRRSAGPTGGGRGSGFSGEFPVAVARRGPAVPPYGERVSGVLGGMGAGGGGTAATERRPYGGRRGCRVCGKGLGGVGEAGTGGPALRGTGVRCAWRDGCWWRGAGPRRSAGPTGVRGVSRPGGR